MAVVESLLKSKETALKYSSKKESSFGETITEKEERRNKFIGDLKSLVKLPGDFVKANKNTKTKIAEKIITRIEEKAFNNLKEDEGKEFNKEEKVCFYCFKKEKTEMMYVYLYFLLVTNNNKFGNLLELNEEKETKLKFINNLFPKKDTF